MDPDDSVASLPDPPDAPTTRRRPRLYGFQWVGLPVLLALPLLALFGVFGERWTTTHAANGSLEVSARYPAVFRYKMIDAIEVHVRNRGSDMLDTVTVALDTAYAARFSTISATPPFTAAFEVDLPGVRPAEWRRVRVEVQAERYWSHAGTLTVRSGPDTVRIPVATFVFP